MPFCLSLVFDRQLNSRTDIYETVSEKFHRNEKVVKQSFIPEPPRIRDLREKNHIYRTPVRSAQMDIKYPN